MEALVLGTYQFLYHLARVGLAEAPIVVLPGGQVAISMLLVDEAVVFLD